MSLVKKAFGVIGSASCLLVGGFFTLVLVIGVPFGEIEIMDDLLPILWTGTGGVLLMIAGLLIIYGMIHRHLEQLTDTPVEDEGR